MTYEITSVFQGPLPPADELERYDQVVPGFAKTLLEEYTTQGAHRRGLEAAVITGNLKAQNRGQWVGMVCFVAAIAGAVVAAVRDQPGVGIAIAAMDFVGFGGVYVWGRSRQEKERESRD